MRERLATIRPARNDTSATMEGTVNNWQDILFGPGWQEDMFATLFLVASAALWLLLC
jgi:hypothetical protein